MMGLMAGYKSGKLCFIKKEKSFAKIVNVFKDITFEVLSGFRLTRLVKLLFRLREKLFLSDLLRNCI